MEQSKSLKPPLQENSRKARPAAATPQLQFHIPFAFSSKALMIFEVASGPLLGAPSGLGIERPLVDLGLRSSSKSWLIARSCFPRNNKGVFGLVVMNWFLIRIENIKAEDNPHVTGSTQQCDQRTLHNILVNSDTPDLLM